MSFLNKQYKLIKRSIGRVLIGRNPFDVAYFYCKGTGLEVGARNNPYRFSQQTKVLYADIADESEVENTLKTSHLIGSKVTFGRFAKVDFILKGPKYGFDEITTNSLDFVYSDNVIEHTPNPIYALMEQLRVVKPGGIVYTVLPNKKFTFDCQRMVTSLAVLKKKFLNEVFTYEVDEALDVILNSADFPIQFDSQEARVQFAQKMVDSNDGVYHFHVFDEKNTLEMLEYLAEIGDSNIEYFSAAQGKHIHFAIRKKSN